MGQQPIGNNWQPKRHLQISYEQKPFGITSENVGEVHTGAIAPADDLSTQP